VRDCEAKKNDRCQLRTLSSIDGNLALFGAGPDFLGQVDRILKNLLASNG
jgi:hypothetical protein